MNETEEVFSGFTKVAADGSTVAAASSSDQAATDL